MSDDLNFTFSLDDIPHFSFGMPDDETLARYIVIKGEKGDNGDGDMSSSVYDTNHNGIVDNAEKVNNHTVAADVPADAVFTDTIYDDTEIRADLNDKVDTADLATVATSGSYADLSNKPTIPTNVSDLTNDSGYQTASDVSTAIAGKVDTADLATVATSGSYNDLSNKPTIPTDNSSYSTSEVKTSATWINGKPIYKKTFSFTLANAESTTINHGISNFGILIKYEGAAISSSTKNVPIPRTLANINYQVGLEGVTTTSFEVDVAANGPRGKQAYITLWYTKTTD